MEAVASSSTGPTSTAQIDSIANNEDSREASQSRKSTPGPSTQRALQNAMSISPTSAPTIQPAVGDTSNQATGDTSSTAPGISANRSADPSQTIAFPADPNLPSISARPTNPEASTGPIANVSAPVAPPTTAPTATAPTAASPTPAAPLQTVRGHRLPPVRTLRILSLDGGGMKGYTSLLILQRIFRTLKSIADMDGTVLKPCQVFDLIIGTSTGGIIATMLGRLHMTIEDALAEYEKVGKRVFGKMPGWVKKAAKGITSQPFFKIKEMQEAMKEVIKAQELDESTPFCDAENPSCKVALCVTNKRTSKPDIFRNYKTSHPTQTDYPCNIWQAASATSAAPAYFKGVKLSDGSRWVDGGFTQNRNNPASEAMAEHGREKNLKDKEIGCLLSIGTGLPPIKDVSNNILSIWMKSVDMLINSQNTAIDFRSKDPGKRLAETNRYFRFSVPQGMDALEMDDFRETGKMSALTTEYFRDGVTRDEIEKCALSLFKPDDNFECVSATETSLLPNHHVVDFVDRPSYMNQLRAFFGGDRKPQMRFVLHGMGGVGKTQLALCFAHECNNEQGLKVFWVRAESFSSFALDYGMIYSKLNPKIPNAASIVAQNDLIERTTALLKQTAKSWLLVLDNADHFETFYDCPKSPKGARINEFLPNTGKILLTTRDLRFAGVFAPLHHRLHVDVMDEGEARNLFVKSIFPHLLEGSSTKSLDRLLQELGNLPLGVAQTAVNIRNFGVTLDIYLKNFLQKHQWTDLLQTPFIDSQTRDRRNQEQSILTTWELSFDFLKKHPPSMKLLEYCSIFHFRAIPRSVIRALPEFTTLSEPQFLHTITQLRNLSLVSDDEHDMHFHCLLHERVFQRLRKDELKTYLIDVTEALVTIFPEDSQGKPVDMSATIRRGLANLLLPHAQSVLRNAADIKLNPLLTVQLMKAVANHLRDSGRRDEALTTAYQALRVAKGALPDIDPVVCHAREVLIECLFAVGKYEMARVEAEAAILAFAKQMPTDDHEALKMIPLLKKLEFYLLNSCYHLSSSGLNFELKKIIERARDTRKFGLASHLYEFADSLKRRGDYRTALKIVEGCIKLVSDLGYQSLDREEKWEFLSMLNLNATILQNDPSNFDTEKRKETLETSMELSRCSLDKSFALGSAANANTWSAANQFSSIARRLKYYDSGLNALAKVINGTRDSRRTESIKGHFLETVGRTILEISQYRLLLDVRRKRSMEDRTHNLITSLVGLLKRFRHDLLDIFDDPPGPTDYDCIVVIEDPSLLNDYAAFLTSTGKPAEGEDLCRFALRIEPDRLQLVNAELWETLHYRIMCSLSLQPEMRNDALKFRNENLQVLKNPEMKYGTLKAYLTWFENERRQYYMARDMRDRGELKYNDGWWKKHASGFASAEFFYGLLFHED